MGEIFWESVRKARRLHFCDRCFEQICPGEVYTRWIWAPPGARSFFVMKEHYSPGCQPAVELLEEPTYESIEGKVAIVVFTEVWEVHKLGINGQDIVELETHLVTRLVTEEDPIEPFESDDDEVPF